MARDGAADSDGPKFIDCLPADTGGLWVVRSASATAYWLDLDQRLLLRAPGPGSSTGAYDDCWVPLIGIDTPTRDLSDPDDGWVPVRVGRRHRYDLDPRPDSPWASCRWWLQREVTTIQAVPARCRPAGRDPAGDENAVPYRHSTPLPGPVDDAGDRS